MGNFGNFARLTALALILAAGLAAAPPSEKSMLSVHVATEGEKKPIKSAHVVVRFISGKNIFRKNERTSWETQTNQNGEVSLDDIPQGRVMIQVIAKGYQTFGNEFELSKEQENVTILLKPPAKQVSAY